MNTTRLGTSPVGFGEAAVVIFSEAQILVVWCSENAGAVFRSQANVQGLRRSSTFQAAPLIGHCFAASMQLSGYVLPVINHLQRCSNARLVLKQNVQ